MFQGGVKPVKHKKKGCCSMYTFADKEYEVLTRPMNRAEIIRNKDENGRINGVVAISLSDLIDGDSDSVRDLLTENLVGSESMGGF